MRVLYLCSDLGIPLDGHKGAAAHIRGFVSALEALDHDVELVSPNGGTLASRHVPTSGLFETLESEIPKRMSRALRHVMSNTLVEKSLEEAIHEQRPDLIYERYSPFAIAGGLVAKAHGIPHMLEVNAPLSREGAAFRDQALPDVAVAMELRAFGSAGHIITVSDELRTELMGLGLAPEKITAIPNGVDIETFAGPEQGLRSDQSPHEIVVGFVGSLKPWHDIQSMLTCFDALTEDERFHFLIVGDGPEMKKIRAFEKKHPGRITITGALSQEDVPQQLAKMDIALAPYPEMDKFYFSPLKILEYMAAGLAIVGSDIGQVSQLLQHEETGLLTGPGKIEEMTEAVRRLADDEDLRFSISRAAERVAAEQHDWKSRVKDVLQIAKTLEV